jgi:hypothetical protein
MGYPVEGKRRRVFNLSKRFVKKSNRVRKHLPSVNDDIDAELFRCSFAKLSDAIDMIRRLREKGESVYMAKADVEDAFTNIPVRDDEMHLIFNSDDLNILSIYMIKYLSQEYFKSNFKLLYFHNH